MTVIVGVGYGDHIVMAADRLVTYGNQAVYGARKIRRGRIGDHHVLMACGGNGALLPTVVRELAHLTDGGDTVPTIGARWSDDELDTWADDIAALCTRILAAATPPLLADQDGTAIIDGTLLLGFTGRLWYLFTHQAQRVQSGVAALGVGSEMAVGAALVAIDRGDTPAQACDVAVRMACAHIPGCGLGPLDRPYTANLG